MTDHPLNMSIDRGADGIGINSNEVRINTPSRSLPDDLCDSGVIDSPSTHRRRPAVCREAVFADFSSSPQIFPEGVRSIFVMFMIAPNYVRRAN